MLRIVYFVIMITCIGFTFARSWSSFSPVSFQYCAPTAGIGASPYENKCLYGQIWDPSRRICTRGFQFPINKPSATDYSYEYDYEYDKRK